MQPVNLDYIVDRREDGWTITFCGSPHGHYARRRDAIASALDDARRAAQRGWHIRVAVRRPAGTLRPIPIGRPQDGRSH